MALTFTWQGGDCVTQVVSGLKIGFYGSNFGDSIPVGTYQTNTNATPDGTMDSGSLPNVKYVTVTTCEVGVAPPFPTDVSTVDSGSCTLRVTMSGVGSVSTQNAKFWAYDGTTDTAAPTVTDYAFEAGDTGWRRIDGGSGTAYKYGDVGINPTGPLRLSDQPSPGATHDYYIAMSATPQGPGPVTAYAFKVSLEYY